MTRNYRRSLGTLILLIIFAQLANGQNIIRPKIECPNNIYVNAYNGVLFYQRSDMSVPARGGNLEVVFYYNSVYNTRNYGYGNGWTLGMEMRYIIDSTGVIIQKGDGRHDKFARYGNSFVTPAGLFATLTKTGTTYQLMEKDGTRYTFGDTATKCVTQIEDRNNNIFTFAYTGSHLTSISDNAGRSILFQWTGDQMTHITTSFNSWSWTYQYDSKGNMVQVTDPNGNNSHYGYNRDNRIATFSDDEGNTSYITYNANENCVTRVKTNLTDRAIHYDPLNGVTTVVDYMTNDVNLFMAFHWDNEGRITSIEGNNASFIARYEYDHSNNIIRQTDGNGNQTSFSYDNNGNLLSATDALNHTVHYTYTDYGMLASYTDQLGHQHRFEYDSHGNMTSYHNPLNQTTSFTYNSYGQIVSTTDALNHTTTYSYDNYGNIASITDALNNTTTYTSSPAGQLSSISLPNGGQYTFNMDYQNRLTYYTNALNQTTRLQYDPRGFLNKIVNPLNQVYNFKVNEQGKLTRYTTPSGDSVTFSYNNRLLPNKIVDGMGNATRLLYDFRSRPKAVIDALGDTTFIHYDGADNITRITTPNGRVVDYHYNSLNQLVLVEDQIDTLMAYAYDAAGKIISSTNELGNTTTYAYNANGKLVQVSDGLGNSDSYTYDAAGNVVSHTDGLNHTTTYAYDAANRLVGETDALGNATSYSYDGNGNVVSMTDANGHTTQYSYDANNQLTEIRFPNNATRQYAYNAAGKVTSFTNEEGETLNYTYNENGLLVGKNGDESFAVSYTRDALGRITSASKGNHTVSFSYDALGRVTAESAGSTTTHYLYNRNNRTRTLSYPGGRSVVEQYDVRNNLVSQSENNQVFANFSYLADGSPLSYSFANNTATSFAYNEADLLSCISATPQILNLQDAYDAARNLIGRVDGVNVNRSEAYTHDNLNRLTEYKRGAASTSVSIPNPLLHLQYALDAVGNRNSVSTDGSSIAYGKNEMNQYTNVGNTLLQYDSKGNLTHDGNHYYDYDVENNLIAVDGGTTSSYTYDALGRRASKTTSEGTTYYFYDGNNLIEERDAQGNTLVSYVFANGIDQVVQMQNNNNTYYYHTDGQGSVMAVTDALGAVVERYAYDPYGTPAFYNASGTPLQQSAIHNRILFTGREYDAESGLYHFRARALQPELGRFNQTDPLLYYDDKNLYSYVANMPTAYVDPLGWGRDIDGVNVFMHTVDIASSAVGMTNAVGKLGQSAEFAMNQMGLIQGGAEMGYGMSNGIDAMDVIGAGMFVADAGLTTAMMITETSAITVSTALAEGTAALAGVTTLSGAAAVWGAFKMGWAVGSLIDDLWGDKIFNTIWKIVGDDDEDIKPTGVYPRFPEPCGGDKNKNQKK